MSTLPKARTELPLFATADLRYLGPLAREVLIGHSVWI